jgi:hypothetical protein
MTNAGTTTGPAYERRALLRYLRAGLQWHRSYQAVRGCKQGADDGNHSGAIGCNRGHNTLSLDKMWYPFSRLTAQLALGVSKR